jgi:hypothetical protein
VALGLITSSRPDAATLLVFLIFVKETDWLAVPALCTSTMVASAPLVRIRSPFAASFIESGSDSGMASILPVTVSKPVAPSVRIVDVSSVPLG